MSIYWTAVKNNHPKIFKMTCRKEVEKVVKIYLFPIGFEYKPRSFKYFRQYANDFIHNIGIAEETHG